MSVHRYTDKMTSQMLDCCLNDDDLKVELLYCHAQYVKCKDAHNITLPSTTSEGKPVIYGAIKEMLYLMNYWKRRGDLARSFLQSCEQHNQWLEEQGLYNCVFNATIW